MLPKEQKHQAFEKELKELLKKYKAEISIEEFRRPNLEHGEFKMVVDFAWDDESFEEYAKTGVFEQLVLGSFVDKD